jgi:hypothetical protein
VKLCIFIGMNIGGFIGWSLGEYIGIGTAFLLSGVGSIAGIYGGWRIARHYLE